MLDSKVDSLAATTNTEFRRLDNNIGNLTKLIKWLSTLLKWLIGIFVTIILGVVALFGTDIPSLFGR